MKGARLEKNREGREEKKAMKEMKRAEAAAKVDENIKRKKASDNKMATLDEANDNFDNLDVGNNDFEYKEHKRNTDRTTDRAVSRKTPTYFIYNYAGKQEIKCQLQLVVFEIENKCEHR